MTWQPYTLASLAPLSTICTHGADLWHATSPLICFNIVEYYHPELVMCEFGFTPTIPPPWDTSVKLYAINKKHWVKNFEALHQQYANIWDTWSMHIMKGTMYTEGTPIGSAYMPSYWWITRMHITNPQYCSPSSSYQMPLQTSSLCI